MKVCITYEHIKAAKRSPNRTNPVVLALRDSIKSSPNITIEVTRSRIVLGSGIITGLPKALAQLIDDWAEGKSVCPMTVLVPPIRIR